MTDYPEGGTFAQLLNWHLENATRPPGTPQVDWKILEFAKLFNKTDVAVSHWRVGRHRPRTILPALLALFGDAPPQDTPHYKWRRDLLNAYNQQRRKKEVMGPAAHRVAPDEPVTISESNLGKVISEGQTEIDTFPTVNNLFVRVPHHFLGRDPEMAAIDAALSRSEEGRPRVAVLHGLRGVGKTILAAEYARRRQGAFRVVWWISAQTSSGMSASLLKLGIRLGWEAEDYSGDLAVERVLGHLGEDGSGALLIYDNSQDANALRPFLPVAGDAKILVTSNSHSWRAIAEPIQIGVWPKGIGAEFLVRRTGRDKERLAAEALSDTLGGLPLALEQAAAYCDQCSVGIAEYHRLFDVSPITALDDINYADHEYSTTNSSEGTNILTVARTFRLAMAAANAHHSSAFELLFYIALFPPDAIPRPFFDFGRLYFSKRLSTAIANKQLDRIIETLLRFALVEGVTVRHGSDGTPAVECIRVHLLVREIALTERAKTTPLARTLGSVVRKIVGGKKVIFDETVHRLPALTYRRGHFYAAWGARVVEFCEDAIDPIGNAKASILWTLIRVFDSGKDFDFLQRSWIRHFASASEEFVEQADGIPRWAEVLRGTLLYELGTYYEVVYGDYKRARRLFQQSVEKLEATLGRRHFWLTTALLSVAGVDKREGRYAESEALMLEVLAIRETYFGQRHLWTAKALDNLSGLYRDIGSIDEAIRLCDKVVDIYLNLFGVNDSHTASSLHYLGAMHLDKGDITVALPILMRSLEIRRVVLPSNHIDIADSQDRIGLIHNLREKYDDAHACFEEVLRIREENLDPFHHEVLDCVNVLGKIAAFRGDIDDLQRYCELAYERLGEEPRLFQLHTLNNLIILGRSLVFRGSILEAVSYLQKSLAICSKMLGSEHLKVTELLQVVQPLLQIASGAERPTGETSMLVSTLVDNLVDMQELVEKSFVNAKELDGHRFGS